MKMTTEEAFVKVLQMHGIEHAFGIIGSAFMPISDLFPKAAVASVVGVGLMVSAVTGMAFAEYAGFSLQSSGGNYAGLFRIAGSSYVVAIIIMHALAPKYKPVEIAS